MGRCKEMSALGRRLHLVENLGNLELFYFFICLLCFKNPQYFQIYCLRQLKLEQTIELPVSTVGNSSLTHRSKRIGKTHFSVVQPTYYLQQEKNISRFEGHIQCFQVTYCLLISQTRGTQNTKMRQSLFSQNLKRLILSSYATSL